MPLPSAHIAEDIEAQGFQWLTITPYNAQSVLELGDHHKDPFDRLLIAQAKYEALCIVTYDAVFQNYLDDVIGIRKRDKQVASMQRSGIEDNRIVLFLDFVTLHQGYWLIYKTLILSAISRSCGLILKYVFCI